MTETSAAKTSDDGARSGAVRVRFCPSPTGTPHVWLIRTALFNWAYARRTGGTLVFRIEDTDAARDSEESYHQLLDAMRWLGLDWDEGVEVGGPHEPYRQSQRMDIYADVAKRLLEAGHAYESFSTPEEVEERHRAAGRDRKSTRLNSSHVAISYAVFCLKKKKRTDMSTEVKVYGDVNAESPISR